MEFDYLGIMRGKNTEDLIELISLTFKKKNGIDVVRGLSNYGLSAACLELKNRNLKDDDIAKLNAITNNSFVILGEEHKQELELMHINSKKVDGLNKKLKIFGGVLILILLFIIGSNLSKSKGSDSIDGIYISGLPRCTVELQKNGKVIISPFFGDNETPHCVTEGTWELTNNNNVNIVLVDNPNCNTNTFNGTWKVKDCSTLDNQSTKCLSFGAMSFIRK
jgi:hypothetical protein